MIEDLVSMAIVDLLKRERFYAEVVLQMDRIYTTKVPTMGVCIRKKIELWINPEFFEKLSPQERVSLLIHEVGHILNDHIPRFKEIAPEVYTEEKKDLGDIIVNNAKHMSMNIAADCALNCNISNLPEGAQLPKTYDLPSGETFEWYHANLKDNEKLKELHNYDGHDLWSMSEKDKELLRQSIRDGIQRAAANAREAGQLSAQHELLISKLLKPNRDWKSVLRQFVATQLSYNLETTRKKRNRRYGISQPGYVKLENLHIGVAIDTSGSVSDEALTQFMSEIRNISKYAKITLIEADAEIKNVSTYDPKKVYKISGRGGTAYKPAFDYFNDEAEVDGVIYFGDMDCYDTQDLKKPKYPVLWAIVGHQSPPATWGTKIYIEIK